MNRKILLLLPLLVSVQCTGTETENPFSPLVSFHASECKKSMSLSTKGIAPPDAGSLASDSGKMVAFDESYDGLQCIAWHRLEKDSFRFELGNFYESCGIDWQGKASVAADGTVELHAINAGCLAAACGWCLYDWTYDVRGVPEGSDTRLAITDTNSDGSNCPNTTGPYDVTLPTAAAEQGILCRPAFRPAVWWQEQALGTTGKLHMPCDADELCADELSCGPLASPDDLRCLARCSADSDCPLPGILACQEGTCRLSQTW